MKNKKNLTNNDKFIGRFSLINSICDKNNELSNYAIKKLNENDLFNEMSKYFDKSLLQLYFRKLLFNDFYLLSIKIIERKWESKNLDVLNDKFEINELEYNGLCLIEDIIKHKYSIKIKSSFFSKIFLKKFIKKMLIQSKKYYGKRINPLSKDKKNKNVKVGVQCYEGLNKDFKNDLYWNSNDNISQKDIVLYISKKSDLIRLNLESNENIYHMWKFSFPKLIDEFYLLNRTIKYKVSNDKINLWICKNFEFFLIKVNFWYQFFQRKNIKIDLDSDETDENNIVKRIALKYLGGISIGRNRSYISEDVYHWVCNFPQDVLFTWGNDMVHRLSKSYNYNDRILISGYPYPKIKKKNNYNFNSKITKKILIFDCVHSNDPENYICISTSTIEKFYLRIFEWLKDKEDIGVIYKTKKMVNYNVLSDEIKKKFINFEKNGRIYIEKNPLRNTVSNFTDDADIAICTTLLTPSVMYECLINNLICLSYSNNLFQEKESSYVNKYFKNLFFNNLNDLITRLDELYIHNFIDNSFDWNCLDEIDPYRDNSGHKRIGNFINNLLNNFKKKLSGTESLKKAIEEY